ncbi:hypothetical protein [Oscillibacter sp.]|uniref:hypothetical protein n=1 Tax=Oscillibacter sp. TaxID=1945593 RepID=UPI0033967391
MSTSLVLIPIDSIKLGDLLIEQKQRSVFLFRLSHILYQQEKERASAVQLPHGGVQPVIS